MENSKENLLTEEGRGVAPRGECHNQLSTDVRSDMHTSGFLVFLAGSLVFPQVRSIARDIQNEHMCFCENNTLGNVLKDVVSAFIESGLFLIGEY